MMCIKTWIVAWLLLLTWWQGYTIRRLDQREEALFVLPHDFTTNGRDEIDTLPHLVVRYKRNGTVYTGGLSTYQMQKLNKFADKYLYFDDDYSFPEIKFDKRAKDVYEKIK